MSSTNGLMQSYTVFDFLPADAMALRTTATLMAGGSVKGILRERQLRRLPRRRCSLIGEATVPEVIFQVPCAYLVSPMAAGCAELLHVFNCNCSALHCIVVSQSALRLCFCASGHQQFSGMYLQARLVLLLQVAAQGYDYMWTLCCPDTLVFCGGTGNANGALFQ